MQVSLEFFSLHCSLFRYHLLKTKRNRMFDKIEKIGNSTIQHGKNNNRVYLLKLDRADCPAIIPKISALADQYKYTKLFAKVPAWAWNDFKSAGFEKEAHIPKFYSGKDDALFLGKYLDDARAQLDRQSRHDIEKNIQLAQGKQQALENPGTCPFEIRRLGEEDISQLTALYRLVFKFYPFPIFKDDYIKQTMLENIIYFGVFFGKKLIAASSAEMDQKSQNVEMTDFATDPQYTGNNLALFLLREMEVEMPGLGIKTLYTIARSNSAGMNITFAKAGYTFSGTLINNTHIFDEIESMNVWYKSLV
ncbi:MAG: putative beta-lysine N-acetyltransferase [Calditrichaeota bacterium]|nr:MAG: putative beta-lysine N-acetyltransferase [Calditrichota bacterium]